MAKGLYGILEGLDKAQFAQGKRAQLQAINTKLD
jgi:hypothetical protein